MKVKKILTATLALAAGSVFLSACGGGGTSEPSSSTNQLAGTYDIKLWCSEVTGVKELFENQIAAFCNDHEGVTITPTIETISEADAATQVITDIEASPDLFCFAQDQFARLVQSNGLSKLGEGAAKFVRDNNDSGAVAAVSSGTDIYAYPMTSDNGYFLYYDKSVVKEEHLDSLEDILADCVAAKRNFSMENETSAWYIASWFFGTGCVSEWTTDEKGNFNGLNDTFNSDAGLIACQGMAKLVKSEYYVSSSDAAQFDAGVKAGALISGTWAYNDVKNILGDNLGAAKLPKFEVNGTKYQMGSFSGNKLLGVKPTSDAKRSAVLHQLAQYLTGAKCQEERFDVAAWGPSNVEAAKLEKVTSNPSLKALAEQAPYSIPQGQIHGSWWDIGKAIGQAVKDAALGDLEAYQAALTSYKTKLDGLVETPVSGMTGSPADVNWSTVREGTLNSSGKWELTTTVEVGDEIQFVLFYKSISTINWDGQCGFGALNDGSFPEGAFSGDATNKGSNIKVEIGGTYKFVWEFETRTVVATAA